MNPELTLLFVHNKSIGYGRYGSYLAQELQNQGVTVWDHFPGREFQNQKWRAGVVQDPEVPDDDPDLTGAFRLRPEGRAQAPEPTNVVAWVAIPSHAAGWWEGQYPVISTMWESSHVPESVRDTIHEFAQVIVPSEQNRELFSEYHDNVKVVPLGIDPKVWHFRERPEVGPFFTFFIAGAGERKGADLAYKAFRKVFGNAEGFSPVPRLINKRLRGTLELDGLQISGGNGFEVVAGRLDDDEEADLYGMAHCYIQPSRGEGFGLQPLQAMAQGCPTILTNAHGHAEYAHLGIPLDWKWAESDYFALGDAKDWWEPDFDQLCEQMWDVYSNYEKHLEKAQWNSTHVREYWTWAETARKFADVLGDELTKPGPGTVEWHETSHLLYPVVTDKPYYAEIAGRALRFETGKTYYETADVKRILFEAHILAADCPTEGLHPNQVEKIGAYQADKSYCPACNQRLNSGVTRADEIMAEGDWNKRAGW